MFNGDEANMKREIKIVAISDTHGHHRKADIPDGDVLVHAGDFMTCGRKLSEVLDFADWFSDQPHEHKILVAGNHDRLLERDERVCLKEFSKNVTYLRDSGVEIRGWKFWGSPYQPEFCNWAFNVPRGPAIRRHWDMIPDDTDMLITHGPPMGIGDQCVRFPTGVKGYNYIIPPTEHLGCSDLLIKVRAVNPELHIFGHIHGGRGLYPPTPGDQPDWKPSFENKQWNPRMKTQFANVAFCDEAYQPTGNPFTFWFCERE